MMSRVGSGWAAALAAGALLGAVVSACGSGGSLASGTVSEQAKQALSSATSGSDPTTAKSVTGTVTQPAVTTTVTKTKTETGPTTTRVETKPGQTSKSSTSKTLVVTPGSTTGGGTGSGVPWWGWVLIALGAVGVGAAIFSLGRHSGGGGAGAQPPSSTPGSPGPPSPGSGRVA